MVLGGCIVVVLQGLRKYFIGLESWLVRQWGICYASSASESLFPAWHDSFLELLFLSLIFWICCVVDVLFFIPVSNGCFCTLICKRYAVMEESLIKRIQLAVAVQIFVLLLLIIYSPDCIYLDSADELFLGLFLLFHKLRECFFLMVNCVSRNSEKSFLYSINDQYILSYMYFASLIIGRHKWWFMKINVEEIKMPIYFIPYTCSLKNAFVGVY